MSRLSLLRLAALAGAVVASGCSGCVTELQKATGDFVMTPQVLDFHNVCLNGTAQFPVSLQNNGNGDLNITKSSVTGSAFTLLTTVPTTIAPHQSAVINIQFLPTVATTYTGFFSVTTDAPKNPTQQATLTGQGFSGANVDFEVSCQCSPNGTGGLTCGNGTMSQTPCYNLSFGNVVVGTSAEATVTVSNNGCEPLSFQEARFYNDYAGATPAEAGAVDWFSIDADPPGALPPTQIPGGVSQSYVVHFTPTAAPSIVDIRLSLQSNNPTAVHTSEGQTVPGWWDLGLDATPVEPALLVTPNILTFFNATQGTPVMQTFLIENTGTSTLQVSDVALSGDSQDFQLTIPGGSPSFSLAGGAQATVTVTFTAGGSGSQQAKVTVTGAGQPTQSVQLIGGAEPQLVVNWLDPDGGFYAPPPVDFGTTAIGATGITRTVQLQNTGTADLDVSAVTTKDVTNMSPSMSFSVQGFSAVTVAAQQSTNVTVVFNDDIAITNDSGKLDIASNDPVDLQNGGVRSVNLTSTNTAIYAPIPDITVSPASPEACMSLTLDATGSSDQQHDPLAYKWAITSVPPGSHATLTAATSVTTNVTSSGCAGPDVPGTYQFTLTVTDTTYPSSTATLPQSVVVH